MLIGDVKGEDAARCEMPLVESDGLGGEQMQGNGVAGEGIDHQHIEFLWGVGGKGGARVPFHDVDMSSGVAQVGEEVSRDGSHRRIDLIKADAIAGTAIGSDGSHAQADDANVACAIETAVAQGETYTGILGVVGGGNSA